MFRSILLKYFDISCLLCQQQQQAAATATMVKQNAMTTLRSEINLLP